LGQNGTVEKLRFFYQALSCLNFSLMLISRKATQRGTKSISPLLT
jgi:hypothetical protein